MELRAGNRCMTIVRASTGSSMREGLHGFYPQNNLHPDLSKMKRPARRLST